MWGSLKHKFVLPFYGIYEFENERASQFFLISPFMTNGTLAQWRKKTSPSVAQIEERVWSFYVWPFVDTHFPRRYWKWLRVLNIFIQWARFMATFVGYFA